MRFALPATRNLQLTFLPISLSLLGFVLLGKFAPILNNTFFSIQLQTKDSFCTQKSIFISPVCFYDTCGIILSLNVPRKSIFRCCGTPRWLSLSKPPPSLALSYGRFDASTGSATTSSTTTNKDFI